ncbi:MAG TPA: asparagine synthase (glutamine-hydrolyzing) [Candidatus Methylomirabilis sp.]|nr:asparagine synthase (glutamine-hydrolyzing) [Candidatus Methylomirabilis sp.]
MCGIGGVVGGSGDYAPNVNAMMRAMAHRGPDGRGIVTFEGGAVGAVRLALVDLSDRGQQPLWSADRRVAIVFNGEMYNHAGERRRLAARGYAFQSSSDTEVVLALYLEHGLEFVHRVRGMFALAILDWRHGEARGRPSVILARDSFGIKPLYVSRPEGSGGPLLFSSELRALLASGLVKPEIDREGLVDYLATGFVLQPRTMIARVQMLERGSLMEIRPDGHIGPQTFWEMPPFQPVRETLDEAADRLRGVLEESVALHAMADAPVGAFLSGGVDSTGMVGLMVKRNARLRTYTLRFPDIPGADEARRATAFATSLGCDHTVVDATSREIPAFVSGFAGEIDQPSSDGLNTWLISRAAAKDVKGVISGLGGDEWFAGYPATRLVRDQWESADPSAHPVVTWTDCHRVFGYQLARMLVNGSPPARGDLDGLDRILPLIGPDWASESPIGLTCRLDVSVYMRCQLLRDSDATSMASSLELRVPLVDVEVARFARTCDDQFKLGGPSGEGADYGQTGSKRVLIHALRDILPRDIADTPKRGFRLPYEVWARRGLGPLMEEMCSREVVAARGLVDHDLVHRLAATRRYWAPWPQAWAIMMLELWCRAVIDRTAHGGGTASC